MSFRVELLCDGNPGAPCTSSIPRIRTARSASMVSGSALGLKNDAMREGWTLLSHGAMNCPACMVIKRKTIEQLEPRREASKSKYRGISVVPIRRSKEDQP